MIYKKLIYIMLIPLISITQIEAYCYEGSCTTTIEYAMGKQRDSISDRLDDFIGVIRANREQTNNQNKIIGQEILGYARLRERIKKEALLLKNAAHLSRQIHGSTVIEHALKNIKKGK